MDKKQLMVIEKYSQPFVQLVFEKNQQDDVYEQLSQIKAVFEETGLAAFLAHIGVEDEEKAKSLRLFQNSDSALLDHLIEVVILNHREALFYDIVRVSMEQIQQVSNCFEVTVSSVAGVPAALMVWYKRSSNSARCFLKPVVLTFAKLLATVSIFDCCVFIPVAAVHKLLTIIKSLC